MKVRLNAALVFFGVLAFALLAPSGTTTQELEVPPCHMCGKEIKGRYWEFPNSGNFYCDSCFAANPHCAQCGEPTDKPVAAGNDTICPACAASQPKCRACGEIIVGTYFTIPEIDGVYCYDCIKTRPQCDICGLPTGGRFTELSDGRKSCSACQETAVRDVETARGSFDTVRDYMAGELNLGMERTVSIQLADMAEINSLGRSLAREEGTKTLGLFRRDGESFTIFVLSDLPHSLTMQTLCHEFGHVWQSDNYPDVSELLLKEGFAEWVSYKALLRLGKNREAEQMRRRTDLYGKGLNLFLQHEGTGGVAGVMALLRR